MRVGMIVFVLAILIPPQSCFAQLSDDQEYMRQALAAGPEPIAKNAAVVRPEPDGNMRTNSARNERVYLLDYGHG